MRGGGDEYNYTETTLLTIIGRDLYHHLTFIDFYFLLFNIQLTLKINLWFSNENFRKVSFKSQVLKVNHSLISFLDGLDRIDFLLCKKSQFNQSAIPYKKAQKQYRKKNGNRPKYSSTAAPQYWKKNERVVTSMKGWNLNERSNNI